MSFAAVSSVSASNLHVQNIESKASSTTPFTYLQQKVFEAIDLADQAEISAQKASSQFDVFQLEQVIDHNRHFWTSVVDKSMRFDDPGEEAAAQIRRLDGTAKVIQDDLIVRHKKLKTSPDYANLVSRLSLVRSDFAQNVLLKFLPYAARDNQRLTQLFNEVFRLLNIPTPDQIAEARAPLCDEEACPKDDPILKAQGLNSEEAKEAMDHVLRHLPTLSHRVIQILPSSDSLDLRVRLQALEHNCAEAAGLNLLEATRCEEFFQDLRPQADSPELER